MNSGSVFEMSCSLSLHYEAGVDVQRALKAARITMCMVMGDYSTSNPADSWYVFLLCASKETFRNTGSSGSSGMANHRRRSKLLDFLT